MTGGFDVILADPPWFYNQRRASGSKFGGGACFHYPLMRDDEILALPVRDVAAENAALFLWATFPRLPFALRVVEAWGFKYKTAGFCWAKMNPDGSPFFGVGYYTKSNAEVCLLGTRGRPPRPAVNDVSSMVISPRREHSRKPEAVTRRIERMYPNSRKLEMFSREPRPGWVTWGNQAEHGGDLLEVLSVPTVTGAEAQQRQQYLF